MKKLIIATMLTFASTAAFAEIAVIINPANSSTLDQNEIKKIYLGKSKSFSNGTKVNPANQEGNAVADEFNDKLLGKSGSQLNAYWSKLIFTGKGTPPKKLNNDQAVIDFVAENADAIGYIASDKVTGAVKVVATY